MGSKNFTDVDDLIKKTKKQDITSSGSFSKEAEPGYGNVESTKIHEVVEHEPSQELEQFVSPRAESIELPPDLKKLGAQSTNNTQFPSYQNIKLPISDEKIIVGLHAPVNSSLRWLATLALYLLAKAHLGLKVVKGKVIRVVRG